jgi:hypothetical protein
VRSPGDSWGGTVDTLPSGRVVVANPDRAVWSAGREPELVELFRVGSLDDEGPEMFGEIRGALLGPDGALHVFDAQASEVRVFGPDGAHRLSFGREGQGPGELNRAAGMAWSTDDRLWLLNWGNARYTTFDPRSGEMVRERRREAGFVMIPWSGAFYDDGRLLDVGYAPDRPAEEGPGLLLLDTALSVVGYLPLPQVDERHRVAFLREGRMAMSMMDPFAPQPSWAPRPRGGIVLGEGETYRLHRVGFGGDTTLTMELDRPPMAVTPAEADSALAAFRDVAERAGGARPERVPRVASHKPAHGALFVDDGDRTWVASGRGSWDVFDGAGRYLGPVPSPSPGRVRDIRAGRVALATSVDGVPTVIVYEVRGLPGGG